MIIISSEAATKYSSRGHGHNHLLSGNRKTTTILMQFHLWSCVLALLLVPCHCARIRRVVGGDKLAVGAWPWLVSLNYKEHHVYLELQGLKHLCGGALIDQYWVLTVAHCLHYASGSEGLGDPQNWVAVLGEYNRNVTESMEQHLEVEALYLHPNYTLQPKLTGDIALMKLRTPAQITATVQPITLDIDREIEPGAVCKAAGWGQHTSDDTAPDQYGNGTMVPHVVEVKRVTQGTCENIYANYWPLIDNTVMCFGSDEMKDTCKGDSGGPLVCEDMVGNPVVSAVVSVGMGCALEDFPGIYTRVSSYRHWILETMTLNDPRRENMNSPV